MNKAQAKAYRDRWHEVQVIELQEARSTSIRDRWRQLNALKLRATRMGIGRGNLEEDFEGYLLWAKLKTTYAASKE